MMSLLSISMAVATPQHSSTWGRPSPNASQESRPLGDQTPHKTMVSVKPLGGERPAFIYICHAVRRALKAA